MKKILVLITILGFNQYLYANEKIVSFASVPPITSIVQAIAGKTNDVHSMLTPGFNPVTYDAPPKQIELLEKSTFYFSANLPFEKSWLPRIKNFNPKIKIVRLNVDDGKGSDPHIWTSPKLMLKMLPMIRDALIENNKKQQALYQKNTAELEKRLKTLDFQIEKILCKDKNKSFMVYHAAWGHFATTYHLKQLAIEHEGKDAGPQDIANVITQAKKLNINTIFTQPQFSHTQARMVASILNAKIETLDPLAKNYFANMLEITNKIKDSFKARP